MRKRPTSFSAYCALVNFMSQGDRCSDRDLIDPEQVVGLMVSDTPIHYNRYTSNLAEPQFTLSSYDGNYKYKSCNSFAHSVIYTKGLS